MKKILSALMIAGFLMAVGCQKDNGTTDESTSNGTTTENVDFAEPNVTPPTELPSVTGPNVELPQE